MVTAGDFKNGITLEMDNAIWQIIEFQHVKPGKGAAFVRTKLKNIVSGGVVEKSFRPTEKFTLCTLKEKNISIYMLTAIYTTSWIQKHMIRLLLSKENVGDSLKFVKENEMVKLCSHNGNVFAIEPPITVELVITESEPGVKGDTATGATKPAIVETGAKILVPLFVNQGDTVKIDTRTGEYLSRV